jgi:hypothetical protein
MNTTAEKIAVMQAFINGERVVYKTKVNQDDIRFQSFNLSSAEWKVLDKDSDPVWDWKNAEYAIERITKVRFYMELKTGRIDSIHTAKKDCNTVCVHVDLHPNDFKWVSDWIEVKLDY